MYNSTVIKRTFQEYHPKVLFASYKKLKDFVKRVYQIAPVLSLITVVVTGKKDNRSITMTIETSEIGAV